MKNLIFLFIIVLAINESNAQPSAFIQVDQFGYKINAEKVAVFSNPIIGFNANLSFQAPQLAELRRTLNQQLVFTGAVNIWNNGQVQAESGDQGWWFDFSAVKDTGSFYVFDPVNSQSSAGFRISENPYADVMKAAGRMYFYNRCNAPKSLPFANAKWTDGINFLNSLQDSNCRYVNDKNNILLEKDLSGGWFDAGDYNKYITFTYNTLHDLLYAFQENPQAFKDDWNIPESGNGIPDLLDEIKWELDWMNKMTNQDGSVHLKMGSIEYSDNSASPPSNNFDPRYYGPVCSSASVTVASVFAHAAIVFKDIEGYEGYSSSLAQKAETCFAYSMPFYNNNSWQTDCDDGSIKAGDADENALGQLERMVSASVYLYEITGKENYHSFFKSNYLKTTPMKNSFWSGDLPTIQDALIYYAYQLNNSDPLVKSSIRNNITTAINNNWNGFFGWSNEDLYRAFTPTWTYHWGSNKPKAAYGSLNMNIAKYNMVPDSANFARKANEQLHYFHGVNPLGMVMLSNMYSYGAEKSVNEIYHTWFNDGTIYDNALTSPNGPAPGFVTGGPNANFSVPSISPPSGQPAMKSYLDFNNGWPDNSWEISEPAIYSQAAYIRLLANQVGKEVTTSVLISNSVNKIGIYPNPMKMNFTIKGLNDISHIYVYDIMGRQVMTTVYVPNFKNIDISQLEAGTYFILIQNNFHDLIYSDKIVVFK
jgi:hypothetical protein